MHYSEIGVSQVAVVVKNLPATAGDAGLTPGLGRSPEVGNDNLLRYFCLGSSTESWWNSWWATVHGTTESNTTE